MPSDVLTFFGFVLAVGPWCAVIPVNHVASFLEARDKLAEAIRSTSGRSRRLAFVHPSALIVVGSPCAGLWLSHWLPAALAFALAAASFGRIPRVACSPCVRAGCGFQGRDGPLRSRWHPLPVRYSGKSAGLRSRWHPLPVLCWTTTPHNTDETTDGRLLGESRESSNRTETEAGARAKASPRREKAMARRAKARTEGVGAEPCAVLCFAGY